MDDIFAEIDIEPINRRGRAPVHPADTHIHCSNAVAGAAVPIAPRTPDPIREKFYEMRRLSSKRPFPQNDSELFYRQAKFMEDFEDSYSGDAAFNMYFPLYQQMGYDYLRTYFTWRTKVRGGEMKATSLSYIFLYIYELLSGIGVNSPAEGLCKLLDIWNAFAENSKPIEINLKKWFKDYHVYYELPQSFSEFVEENNLNKHYSLTLLPNAGVQNQLSLWKGLSGYDISKSRFYKDGNEELVSKCFDAVIKAIQEFCNEKGVIFEDMLVYSVSPRRPWKPFANALFGSGIRQNDREVHISKYERYYCKNGGWTAALPIYYSSQRDFIGYLIKKTEASLRDAAGYKYKLAAEMKPGAKPFRELQRAAAKRAELDKVIGKAVCAFYEEQTRTVVTVDHKNLDRIREEAKETQEQLIVEDDGARLPPVADEGMAKREDVKMPKTPLTLSFSDGWEALKKELTDVEKGALSLALKGGDIKAYALAQAIMLEVLVDEINGKASDCIGDSIIDLGGEAYIYDEYRDNVEEITRQ